jgi:hypothetical protein
VRPATECIEKWLSRFRIHGEETGEGTGLRGDNGGGAWVVARGGAR